MTLDEAIKICEEVAEEQEKAAKEWHENQVRKCELFHFAEMDYTHENECKECVEEHRQLAEWLKDYKRLLEQEPKAGHWIPVKWHEITDEEREREGYSKDWVCYLDSEMPYDGQRILVTTKGGYVELDECYSDDGQTFSLDSGYDWVDDIIAWMPLPEPQTYGYEKITVSENSI